MGAVSRCHLFFKERVLNQVADGSQHGAMILVVADDQELRDGIEALLGSDGYRISPTGNEHDAFDSAVRTRPDLILVSFDKPYPDVSATTHGVRESAGLSKDVPIVIFGCSSVPEGVELAIGANTYVTQPKDFNQLRHLLARLLRCSKAVF